MKTYPIIRNCNFESDDAISLAVSAARGGMTKDPTLINALDALESTLIELADNGDVESVDTCRSAESVVRSAYADVAAEIDEARQARYID